MYHLTRWQLFLILFTSWYCSLITFYLLLNRTISPSFIKNNNDLRHTFLMRQQSIETRRLRSGTNKLQLWEEADASISNSNNNRGRIRLDGDTKSDLFITRISPSFLSDEISAAAAAKLEGNARIATGESLDPHMYESHVLYKYDYETSHQPINTPTAANDSVTSSEDSSWKPSNYPNPINDPEACGISSVLNAPPLGDSSKKLLLLCDPDHVLQQAQLGQIARSIWDFPPMAIPNTSSSYLSGCSTLGITTRSDQKQSQQPIPSNNDTGDDPTVSYTSVESLTNSSSDAAGNLGGTTVFSTNFAEVQVAVAIVSKIDLRSIFLDSSWHSYQDQADLFNDATQYFSRYLFDQWMTANNSCSRQLGILIFVSVKDFACYVVGGSVVASVLPWWRMEYVANEITMGLKHQQDLGEAIIRAIDDLRIFIEIGPPTMSDKIGNFLKRFGVVVGFSLFAFTCAFGSEYGDRLRRWHVIEKRSKLSPGDKIRALSLQEEYHCTGCPICLEDFQANSNTLKPIEDTAIAQDSDELVPLLGSDGLPLKLLRCGHAFDYTCWKCWVDKGHGDPFKCPVCRQDIGRSLTSASKREYRPNSTTSLNSRLNSHPDYESVSTSWYQSGRLRRQGSHSTPHLQNTRGNSAQSVIH